MKFINTGATRLVFLTKNYAIKIPRVFIKTNKFYGNIISFLEGWKANRYEYKWSKSKIFDFLAPIEYSILFSMVIVMKRAQPMTETEFNNLEKFNFGYEHKQDSIGFIDNKPVILDYG